MTARHALIAAQITERTHLLKPRRLKESAHGLSLIITVLDHKMSA